VRASLRALLGRLRRRAYGEPIPLADLRALDAAARRTRLVRLVLAAALAAAAIAAVVVAPTAQGRHFLPASTVGIVVLDLSSSVQPNTYYLIENELAKLAATKQRFGLVVFSDVAYEALPPGTPASELRPLLRFFTPENLRRVHTDELGDVLAQSPWEQWFSAGTNISSGLLLAAQMLKHEHVKNGAVVLISDLADDPTDLTKVADTIILYAEENIPLRVVALNPTPENAEFFANLLGGEGMLRDAKLPTGNEARGKLQLAGTFPTALAVFAALLLVLLGLNEWWAEPLRWRRRGASA
jgi:hypothetical protein